MKLIVIATSCWPTPDTLARAQAELPRWQRSVRKFLSTDRPIVACGTWSDPCLCPVDAEVVNANITYDREYNAITWAYGVGAIHAALWYCMMVKWPWDVVGLVDQQTLMFQDCRPLMDGFMDRSEDTMSPACSDGRYVDDVFTFFKKPAVERILNCPIKSWLAHVPEAVNTKMLWEEVLAVLCRGHWWNPFPEIKQFRMDWTPIRSHAYVFGKALVACRIPKTWLEDYDRDVCTA